MRAENWVDSTYSLYSMRCLKSGVIAVSCRTLPLPVTGGEEPDEQRADQAVDHHGREQMKVWFVGETPSHDCGDANLCGAGQDRRGGADEPAGHERGQREAQTQDSNQITHESFR